MDIFNRKDSRVQGGLLDDRVELAFLQQADAFLADADAGDEIIRRVQICILHGVDNAGAHDVRSVDINAQNLVAVQVQQVAGARIGIVVVPVALALCDGQLGILVQDRHQSGVAVCRVHIDQGARDLDDDTLWNLAAVGFLDALDHLGCRLGRGLHDVIGDEHLDLAALRTCVQGKDRDPLLIEALDAGNQGDQVFRSRHNEGINILGDEVVDRVQDLVCVGLGVHDLQFIAILVAGVRCSDHECLDELGLRMLDDHTDGLFAIGTLAGRIRGSFNSPGSSLLDSGGICLLAGVSVSASGRASAARKQHDSHRRGQCRAQDLFQQCLFHNFNPP